jgi:excisionase family DNA binding protein
MLSRLPSGDWLMVPPVMPDKAIFATLSNCYVEKPGESVFVLLPGRSEQEPPINAVDLDDDAVKAQQFSEREDACVKATLHRIETKLDNVLKSDDLGVSNAASVTIRQAARTTGLSYTTLLRAIKDGRLSAHKVGRGRIRPTYRVSVADLQKFIEASRVQPPDSPTIPTTRVRRKSRHFD